MRDRDQLVKLVHDARRFVMYHRGAIDSYPLQTYASALLFSPSGSLIRQLFVHEEPKGITIWPAMSDGWSACLQILEGHSHSVASVAFSLDSAQLASASHVKTVKIWDASSGASLSADGIWIKHADENMLWVPSEYRSSCSSVSGLTVAMGVGSGRLWSCRIDP